VGVDFMLPFLFLWQIAFGLRVWRHHPWQKIPCQRVAQFPHIGMLELTFPIRTC
jgi:hypothetical protein